jgi:phosphomannomutase
MKALTVFDLDGTFAASKSAIDSEMATLITALLAEAKVAIISGGAMPQFQKQILAHLPHHDHFDNLSLLPTCGTRFFRWSDDWHKLYSEDLSGAQKHQIIAALNAAVTSAGFQAKKVWGDAIEDRESQITYSALGQQAPLDEKKTWDPDFSVRLGGSTSIDVTLPGIDKAYGIRKLRDVLKIPIAEMIYVGDALFPGGNDFAARGTGAVCIQVQDPNETKRVIEAISACLSAA